MACYAGWFAACLFPVCSSAEERVDFSRDIRPLLSDRCIFCHGPDAGHRQADLRLDDAASAYAARDGVAAIVPGDLSHSTVIERITSTDPDVRMPPPDAGKDLSPAEIELLRRWVAQGGEFAPHWAYVPPARVDPPAGADHPIDAFIRDRLSREGHTPAPVAEPRVLARRLSFDLTGLPPTADVVDRLSAAQETSAWSNYIDRLLASDQFGERMAMYWLDLVRYADTVGYHGDQDHNSSPYRDWVIDAFAADMPFDEFTRKQLAGDLLPNRTIDDRIASAYNRLLQTSHEGGLQPKEYLSIYAADRVRNVSQVWMGATVGCAQCHDHKFDPYTIHDFYSLAAFFADVDEAQHFKDGTNELPTRRAPEIRVLTRRERTQLANLSAELATLQQSLSQTLSGGDLGVTKELNEQITRVTRELTQLQSAARLVMVTQAIEPRPMRVLPRGNWQDESGPLVNPAVPEFFGVTAQEGPRATRLDLAEWLVDPREGSGLLTARVFVNRVWMLLMGRGLASVDDFGGQGEPPTHPELLDWLTHDFVEHDWSVKHLVRRIVTSQTYSQSSAVTPATFERDPENRLYARGSIRRLSAEMVRDQALFVSGLLVSDVGGASVRPYQPAGYYRHLNFPTREYTPQYDARQYRRGLYVHWQRQFLHPMLKAFDATTREECTAQRPQSNTPLAALVLLNDPSFVEAARGIALRMLTITAPDAELAAEANVGGGRTSQPAGVDTDDGASPPDVVRLQALSRLILTRPLTDDEQAVLRDLVQTTAARFADEPARIDALLETGMLPVPDDVDRLTLATWAEVARVMLNLDETMTRY